MRPDERFASLRPDELRALDFDDRVRPVGFRTLDLRAAFFAVDFRVPDFRAVDFREPDLFAVDFREPDFFAVDFREPDFFAVDFREPDFFAVDFREADFFAVDLRPDVFRPEEAVRFEPLRVRPSCERSRFTVRAAISFARSVGSPRSAALSLMCSYLRSSLLLQLLGMARLLVNGFSRVDARACKNRARLRRACTRPQLADATASIP